MAPDLITYRLGENNFCYIPPPKTYEEAIKAAKANYRELKNVDPKRFTFCVIARVAGERQHIRISPASWPIVIPRLQRYEILDIVVGSDPRIVPDIVVHSAKDVDNLPTYEDIKEKTGLDDFLAPSCHSSPQHKQVSLESLRAVQRSHRPMLPPSRPKSSSPSSSLTDLAKSLFSRNSSQQ